MDVAIRDFVGVMRQLTRGMEKGRQAMRRHSSGRTDSLVATNQGEQGFWPSYADMMSSLALILFFLMLISYIQNLITGNDLQSTQEVLADTQSQLALTQTQVKDAEDELALITVDLDKARLTLSQRGGGDLRQGGRDYRTAGPHSKAEGLYVLRRRGADRHARSDAVHRRAAPVDT